MKKTISPIFLCLAFVGYVSTVKAQDSTRSGYSIFKPMPRALMRKEMETDRPNITETPHTVEAGHFQYEADVFKHRRQTNEDTKERLNLFNQANLKLGLLTNTALQVIIQSYGEDKEKDLQSGKVMSRKGFGDMTLRIKQNLAGNYEGDFALAIMPYIKLPTNRYSDNKSVEEGLLIPMLFKLPKEWKIGVQVEGDRLQDDETSLHHAELLQSMTVSHVFFNKLEVFGETYYTYNFKDHQMKNFLNAAVELEITPDLKVDTGINYGFQRSAHKDYFVGVAFRY